MKKIKLYTTLAGLSALGVSCTPVITSCGCNPTETYTVTLYGGGGMFGSKNTIYLNAAKGTKLKDVSNYVQPLLDEMAFDTWVDAEGEEVSESVEINSDMLLCATFKEQSQTPTNFSTDYWSTVIKACESAVTFANAYLKDGKTYTEEAAAITAIKNWIRSGSKERYMKVDRGSYELNSKVRLIDVGYDKSTSTTKTLFTFEFAEVFGTSIFGNNATWYTNDSTYSTLWWYLNNVTITYLPTVVQNGIVPVTKQTYGSTDSICKLFVLNSKEMRYNDIVSQEVGEAYAYYELASRSHIKPYTGTTTGFGYWLRTAYISTAPTYVTTKGGIAANRTSKQTLYYAPAFCF